VVEGGKVQEKLVFQLRDWLRNEDLFDYGMSPQFLSRFDAQVLLEDLGEDELVKIFLETPDSAFHQSRAYFESRGIHLALSPAAVRRIAAEAGRQPRLGARALKEVFRRVIRDYEFSPESSVTGGPSSISPRSGGVKGGGWGLPTGARCRRTSAHSGRWLDCPTPASEILRPPLGGDRGRPRLFYRRPPGLGGSRPRLGTIGGPGL
jgi:hypothetical protein